MAHERLFREIDDRPAPRIDVDLVARAQAGDAAARAELVDICLPLIASVARNYRTSPQIQRLELVQEGVVGLLRALERFEPDRGVPFWGYAAWWVRQAMQQLVAELTRPLVLSDRALRNLARVREAHREALAETGPGAAGEPSSEELSRRSGLSPGQVSDLLAAERTPRSLDEPVPVGDGLIGAFGELVQDPLAEGEYERVLDAIVARDLLAALAELSPREQEIVRARSGLEGEERSLRQIAGELGVSAERVRQIEQRALGKLGALGNR